MFGLSKLEAGLIAGVLALLGLLVYGWVEQRHGAQKCEAGDVKIEATAEVKNAHVEAAGTVADANLEANRAKAAATPAAPAAHVSVQPAPDQARACPAGAARPATSASQQAADVRAPGAPGGVQPYLSPEWVDAINQHLDAEVQRGLDADVEVNYLRGLLIERDQVCRGVAPTTGPPP